MNIEAKILKTIEKMPVFLKEELLHYAEYLQEKYSQENLSQQNSNDLSADFRQAWHEAMTGQTIPVSELWEESEEK